MWSMSDGQHPRGTKAYEQAQHQRRGSKARKANDFVVNIWPDSESLEWELAEKFGGDLSFHIEW